MIRINIFVIVLLLFLSCKSNDYHFGTELSFSIPDKFYSSEKVVERAEAKYFSTANQREALEVSYYFKSKVAAQVSRKVMEIAERQIRMRFKPVLIEKVSKEALEGPAFYYFDIKNGSGRVFQQIINQRVLKIHYVSYDQKKTILERKEIVDYIVIPFRLSNVVNKFSNN